MMNISKLEIKNFRSFEHEEIELDDITVFVGENNTGKSSIMDAIKFVIGTPSWNEGFSRYDYHLKSSESNPGDAGDILVKVEMSEKQENEWSQEIQQTIPEAIDYDDNGLSSIYYSLKGRYDNSLNKSMPTREFLNKNGETKGAKANTQQTFGRLKNLLPVFQIASVRNFEAEFQQKRGLFKKFLDSDTIEPENKIKLEKKLTALNSEIIEILKNIKLLKTNLTKSMSVLSGTEESSIDVESIPTNLDSLIEKAGIVLQNATGVKLPLERQGSGALSLAVVFLYEAYLSVLITEEFDEFATPILLIEEPEAHLHPSAVRLFWSFLEKMPGQKIISTHSGDIISKVPLSKIRKIVGTTGNHRIKRIIESNFNEKEKRMLQNHIIYNRGELFFAKYWLLVEGETEYIFFENLLNQDNFLDRKGIRIIEFTKIGLETLIKIANDIHVPWFIISDGDPAGQGYKNTALKFPNVTTAPDDYFFSFPDYCIEVYLMNNGFESYYLSKFTGQLTKDFQDVSSSPTYYTSVYKKIKDAKSISKPEIIIDIVDSILSKTISEPSIISEIKTKLEEITSRRKV